MNKQYIIKHAYTDSLSVDYYFVLQYENGKLESDPLIPSDQLGEYVETLERFGFKPSYYVPEYQEKLDKARQELDKSISEYYHAVNNALVLFDDNEVARYKRIAGHSKEKNKEGN